MVKHIVCFGDSNTHGHCVDPHDSAEGGRFNELERWTCLLQKRLGPEYLVCEEGLTGRTTAFDDPMRDCMNGLDSIYSCVMSHEPVDLLIMMLGTNDVRERFELRPEDIADGMERLVLKAKSLPAWRGDEARILVIAPPRVSEKRDAEFHRKSVKLARLYEAVAKKHGCAFLDAEGIGIFNSIDHMHLTRQGHFNIAEKLASLVPELIK